MTTTSQTIETITASPRHIPVAATVDVLVAGGTLAAVAAAVATARDGARVLLVSARMSLGEDVAAALRLWRDPATTRGTLTDAAFGGERTTTPLRVKRALEDAALAAGVELLLGSTAQDLLLDDTGRAAGLLIVNRAGRQAIRATTVIDATTLGLAPAADGPWSTPLSRVIIGGQEPTSGALPVETHEVPVSDGSSITYRLYRETISLPDRRPATLHAAENAFRLGTFRPGQLRAGLSQWSPAPVRDVSGLIRLDDADEAAGIAAAAKWREAPAVGGTGRLPKVDGQGELDLHECLGGLRPTDVPTDWLAAPRAALAVLARTEVLVVGGGTSGASAAIAAARAGRRVLVLEFHDGLGGVGTLGLIGKPYAGRDIGHAHDVPFPNASLTQDDKMQWFHDEIRRHGGEVWYHAVTWGAINAGTTVAGVAVATPYGAGAVLADVVIDATGSADVAVAAGAGYTYGADAEDLAIQGTGLPIRPLGGSYVNSDYLLVDEHDMRDVTRALLGMRQALDPAVVYDAGDFIQTRERRCVVGEHSLSYIDQVIGRTYPDTIMFSCSDYDSHGYPSLPYFALLPHTDETKAQNHPAPQGTPYTPYRCLLPRGLDGILVVGIGISMHRDASAMVRMQRDVHNMGYAAGLAADAAITAGVAPRHVDLPALQRLLVELDILPAEVLTHQDSLPLSEATVAAAVDTFCDTAQSFAVRSRALAELMASTDTALPLLRRRYADGAGAASGEVAAILGFLGCADGVPELIAGLDDAPWDARILQGFMAEYAHLPTPLDARILALGYSRDPRAIEPILRRVRTLDATQTLSHHRSIALALSHLADPAAAPALAELLAKPGMAGHTLTTITPLHDKERERRRREGPLREIVLARALYRCGDHHHIGRRTLEAYRHDLRGLLSRHAHAVLASCSRP